MFYVADHRYNPFDFMATRAYRPRRFLDMATTGHSPGSFHLGPHRRPPKVKFSGRVS